MNIYYYRRHKKLDGDKIINNVGFIV